MRYKNVKILIFFMLSIVMGWTALSCSNEPFKELPLGFALISSESKNLYFEDDSIITSVQYEARPLFTIQSPYIIAGATSGFKTVGFSGTTSEIMGPFTQGKWHFTIKALNSSNKILYIAENTLYINATSTAIIPFNIQRQPGSGTLTMEIECPRISAQAGEMLVAKIDGNTFTAFTKTIENKKLVFRGSTVLPTGTHTLSFFYQGGGEAMSVNIIDKDVVSVTGFILPAYYEDNEITVASPSLIQGHITGDTKISPNVALSLNYVFDKGTASDNEIYWYVNGNDSGKKGKNFSFIQAKEGNYTITAIVRKQKQVTTTGSNGVEVTRWDETTSAAHMVKVQTLYKVIVNRINVLTSGTPTKNGTAVSFPYTAYVTRLHTDGKYTPYELGFDV